MQIFITMKIQVSESTRAFNYKIMEEKNNFIAL